MTSRPRRRLRALVVASALCLGAPPAHAADLQFQTVAAFDRYVQVTEARADAQAAFLWVDSLPDPQGHARRDGLRSGALLIERITTRDGRNEIPIPGGLVHHWMGAVFVPGSGVEQALTLLQDYDRHAEIYRPAVVRSNLIGRNGDQFRVFLRFSMTKVMTVVVNTEHDARFSREGPDRARSRILSTRIAQVEDAGKPTERELPVGQDGGYLWRLNTYWRFLEADGGVYVQCESISLTRGIPFGFGWMIRPFVTSIPRESLEFTLHTTRKTLAQPKTR